MLAGRRARYGLAGTTLSPLFDMGHDAETMADPQPGAAARSGYGQKCGALFQKVTVEGSIGRIDESPMGLIAGQVETIQSVDDLTIRRFNGLNGSNC